MRGSLCTTLACLLLGGVVSTTAQAAGLGCYDGHFFPRGGAVPANLPGILFWPTWAVNWTDDDAGIGLGPAEEVALFRVGEGGELRAVSFTLQGSAEPFLVVPDGGFAEGAEYRIWTRPCGELSVPAEMPPPPDDPALFETWGGDETPVPFAVLAVSAPAEVPSNLPPLTAGEPVREVIEYKGDCSGCGGPYDVVSVYVSLGDDLGAWADALAFATRVDDADYKPSPYYKFPTLYGKSWVGPGRDRLAAFCVEADRRGPLEQGRHDVRLSATIPGFELTLESNVVSVELDCSGDDTREDHDDPGTRAGIDAGTSAENADGGPGGDEARRRTETTIADAGGGCALRGPTPERAHGAVGGLFLAAWLLIRRRRA